MCIWQWLICRQIGLLWPAVDTVMCCWRLLLACLYLSRINSVWGGFLPLMKHSLYLQPPLSVLLTFPAAWMYGAGIWKQYTCGGWFKPVTSVVISVCSPVVAGHFDSFWFSFSFFIPCFYFHELHSVSLKSLIKVHVFTTPNVLKGFLVVAVTVLLITCSFWVHTCNRLSS